MLAVNGCVTLQYRSIEYTYNAKGEVTGILNGDYDGEYSYDRMGRVKNRTTNKRYSYIQNEDYIYRTYTKNGITYTTNQLVKIEDKTNRIQDRTSTYDENGNIAGISNNGNSYTYTYDAAGRLTQEKKNGTVQKTYTYDYANNIQKTGLTYVNRTLIAANGKSILYDEMGNPTTYKGQTFTWGQGRKLMSGTMNGKSFMYSYDGNGMRYKKEVNGVKTEYYYNDTKLIMENHDGARIYFVYGPTGVEGFFDEKTYSVNGMYYYDKNTLGDIVAIRNRNGEIVAKYEYDAWGRVTVMDKNGYANTQADFIGNISLNTKTLQWIGEEEWRFGIPKIQAESNVVPFDFDESLYLGENIEEEWKEKLLEIAKEQGLLVYQRKLDSTKSKWIYEKFY